MNTIAYESLIYNKANISNWWGKDRLLSKWYWHNQMTIFKRKIDPFFTSENRINFKCIRSLIKFVVIKNLETTPMSIIKN